MAVAAVAAVAVMTVVMGGSSCGAIVADSVIPRWWWYDG